MSYSSETAWITSFLTLTRMQPQPKWLKVLQLNLGLDNLAKEKLAFINFTAETLNKEYPLLLPNTQLVVEILETVKPTKKLLNICKKLHGRGYKIALDDYEHHPNWSYFLPYISIIKVDFKLSTDDEIHAVVHMVKKYPHIELLAEKVETYAEFEQAKELGFVYFQGYFFSKPEVIKSRTLNPSQAAIASLMAELSLPSPNMKALSDLMESDVNLSYKLLRYAQSPIFKRRKAIENIKQAVIALGQHELKRFVSLLFTSQFTEGKPPELTTMSQSRAHFCEFICAKANFKEQQPSAFLVGMLSLLDAMLDTDLNNLITALPVSDHIKQALLDKTGPLADILSLCRCLEQGMWSEVPAYENKLRLSTESINQCYTDAIVQSEKQMQIALS